MRSCRQIISAIAFCLLSSSGTWAACVLESNTCTSDADVTLASGFVVPGVCTASSAVYSCTDPFPLNECLAVELSTSCTELESRCLIWQDGECLRTEKTVECHNEMGDMSPARLIDTRFEDYDVDEVNACTPYQSDPDCTLIEATCTSGPATVELLGLDVDRVCWGWEREYVCKNATTTSTCGVFEADASCRESGASCLVADGLGGCSDYSVEFTCGNDSPTVDPSCEALNVCIGERCEGIEEPDNDQFAEAATWLTWLDDLSKDGESDYDTAFLEVFTGRGLGCRVGILGTLDCCADTGWALGTIGSCDANEIDLIDRQAVDATIYVGSYCSSRFLFICAQTEYVYCAYNSTLARVFQEQINVALGRGYGTARSPECGGLTFEQMQSVDLSTLDLSDAFTSVLSGVTNPDSDAIEAELISELGSLLGAVDGTFD